MRLKEAAKDVQKDKKDKIEEKAEQKETEYVYDPTGKRDPFRSAILGESLRGRKYFRLCRGVRLVS